MNFNKLAILGACIASFILGIQLKPNSPVLKQEKRQLSKKTVTKKTTVKTSQTVTKKPDGTVITKNEVENRLNDTQIIQREKSEIVTKPVLPRYNLGLELTNLEKLNLNKLDYKLSFSARLGELPIFIGPTYQIKQKGIGLSIVLEL